MSFIDKFVKRGTKVASQEAKKEFKKTAVDLIPGILTIVGAIAGVMIFRSTGSQAPIRHKPDISNTRITTNNYFLGNVSEDVVKKILEDR